MKKGKFVGLLNYQLSFKKNLAITFFTIFLIPVIVISMFFVLFIYTSMDKSEINKIETSLKTTEQNFNQALNVLKNFSDHLYVNKTLQSVLTKKYNNIQEIYENYGSLTFLEDYLSSYTEVSSYRIYTENQTLLDNRFILKVTENVAQAKWYNEAKQNYGRSIWIFKEDPVSKKSYLSLVRSLWNKENDSFYGVLEINLNPKYVQTILENSIYDSFIVLGYNIIYNSQGQLPSSTQNLLINYFISYNLDRKYIKRISVAGGEKMGIFAVDFNPGNTLSLNFKIIYIVPVKQITTATVTTVIVCVIFVFLIIFLSFSVIITTSFYINSRVKKIQNQVNNIIGNNFDIASTIEGNDEFEQIYQSIYELSVNMKNLVNEVFQKNLEKEQLALEQSEISFKMLANQINPHFLFNTIETIRMKSISNGDKDVATMLKLLASLLRYNLNVKGQPVCLCDELNAVQSYLTIQNMRFGDRVTYDVATMCDVVNIKILPLIIQPLVENSFVHGLENKLSGGFIYVLINQEEIDGNSILKIQIQDNGEGISDEKLTELQQKLKFADLNETTSIGLFNVNSRIKIYYKNESGISIQSKKGEGTTVTITIIQKIENK